MEVETGYSHSIKVILHSICYLMHMSLICTYIYYIYIYIYIYIKCCQPFAGKWELLSALEGSSRILIPMDHCTLKSR